MAMITASRNDGFGLGDKFLDRVYDCVSHNLGVLSKMSVPVEYIVVDWNPEEGKHLDQSVLGSLPLKFLIVDKSVVVKEGHAARGFYEYFAKNAGVRFSKAAYKACLNTDVKLSAEIVDSIQTVVSTDSPERFFYRPRYRWRVEATGEVVSKMDLNVPEFKDNCICGYFSGDFVMVRGEYWPGYDETNAKHNTHLKQTGMDAEMLWKLYYEGFKLQYLDGHYIHIEHPGVPIRMHDGEYNQRGYTNRPDWGFAGYPVEKISDNVHVRRV